MDPLKDEMVSLSERVTKIENSENYPNGNASNVPDDVSATITKMQKQIEGLLVIQKPVIVVGGLSSLGSFEEAKKWIKSKLSDLGAPSILDVWIYGDFGDIIFVRFGNNSERDAAINQITREKLSWHLH